MYQMPLSEENKKEILKKLKNGEFSNEEIKELIPLLPALGLKNQIFVADASTSPEQLAMIREYMDYHRTLPPDYAQIPIAEIQKASRKLFDPQTKVSKKKEILILLGHHGTAEALAILDDFLMRSLDDELKYWAKTAADECQMFMQNDENGEPASMITPV